MRKSVLLGLAATVRAVALFGVCLLPPGMASGATLTGAFIPLPAGANIDLSASGALDWCHSGYPSEWNTNFKYGVRRQITYTLVTDEYFTEGPYMMETGPASFSWTNGTPVRSAANTTNGVSLYGDKLTSNIPVGFKLQCLAGTTLRRFLIYVGTSGGQATLRASLGQAPGPTYLDTSFDGTTGPAEGVYELTFLGDSPNQVLTVNFESSDTSGYIFMKAAILKETRMAPSPVIAAPDDGTVYPAPATFPLTASTADPDGITTNLSLFNGTTLLGTTSARTLTVWVTNRPAGPHTFTAVAKDLLGLSATSFPSSVYVTTGGGTLVGSYATPPSRINLTAEGTVDWAHWGHYKWDSFDHKAGVVSRIPNIELLNTTDLDLWSYGDNLWAYSWQDGTPTAVGDDSTTGVFLASSNVPTAGFQITVPATNKVYSLKLYVGVFGAAAQLSAWMTDWSAPPWFDSSAFDGYGRSAAVYTFRFASPNPSASLRISWTPIAIFVPEYGALTWQSATLQQDGTPAPPVLRVIPPPAPNQFAFAFGTEPGSTYAVQFAEGLVPPNWQNLTNFPGTGAEVVAVDSMIAGARRFYRVLVQ